jgi:N-acyl homoserine lactone hydrolase
MNSRVYIYLLNSRPNFFLFMRNVLFFFLMERTVPHVRFSQLIEGLSLRPKTGFFGYSSVTLIQDGDENILFDTGGYGVRAALREKLKDTPIHKVFLSHLHFDHCANISLFKDAEIYIHKAELEGLHDRDSIYSDFSDFIATALQKSRVVAFSGEEKLSENTKIILTPGHTAGHSSLEILSQLKKTIVAGDAIETYQEYLDDNYPDNSFDENSYLLTKRSLKEKFSIIIPGHASIIEDGILNDSTFSLKSF